MKYLVVIPDGMADEKIEALGNLTPMEKAHEEKLLSLMVYNPRKRFNIPMGTDFSIWDLRQSYIIEPEEQFQSMGKSTPFTGWKVSGRCKATVCDGKLVYKEEV